MAQKGRRRAPPGHSVNAAKRDDPAGGKAWPPDTVSPPSRPKREIRPYIYAGFDFAMAVLYTLLLLEVSTRHASHAALLWSSVGGALLAGLGTLWRSRWGWRAGVAGCVVLLAVTVAILVLILLSASFLAGVYGSMGQGGAAMALVAGALVIELVGLLPAFQLKFLLTRAGRRHFSAARSSEAELLR